MPIALEYPRAVASGNGVLFTGGVTLPTNPASPATSDSLWLDVASGEWQRVTPLAAITVVQEGGKVLAAGPSVGDWAMDAWQIAEFDRATLSWSTITDAYDADWMAPAIAEDGTIMAVALDRSDDTLRGLSWANGRWNEVAATQDGAGYVTAIEPVHYPPLCVWSGTELIMGGTQGLVSFAPSTGNFSTHPDERIRSFGASSVWTGREVFVSASQSSEGYVFEPES